MLFTAAGIFKRNAKRSKLGLITIVPDLIHGLLIAARISALKNKQQTTILLAKLNFQK